MSLRVTALAFTTMSSKLVIVLFPLLAVLAGCSTTSSSNVVGSVAESRWEGPVFVSQATIPAGIKYKVIGSVQAEAHVGYDNAATLYPQLAAEAKKVGANAVINTSGGRRVTAFSWAAAYVTGTAVKVDDPEKLKGLSGTFH